MLEGAGNFPCDKVIFLFFFKFFKSNVKQVFFSESNTLKKENVNDLLQKFCKSKTNFFKTSLKTFSFHSSCKETNFFFSKI